MKVSTHFLFSLSLAAALYPFFGWKTFMILIGGVLIDIDHYFWYVFKHKKLNLFSCYKYYLERMDKEKLLENVGVLLIFHTIEFLLVMTVLSFYSELAIMLTLGLLLHYALDLIFLYLIPKRFIANHSIIHWIFVNKIQKV